MSCGQTSKARCAPARGSVSSTITEEQQQIFSAGVEAFSAGAAAALAANYDFSRHRRVRREISPSLA
jgi:hypothetical protein